MNLQSDKIIHLLCCFCIVAVLFQLIGYWSIMPAMVAAFGKEVYDYKSYGLFDWKDIKADVIGIISGVLVMSLIELIKRVI